MPDLLCDCEYVGENQVIRVLGETGDVATGVPLSPCRSVPDVRIETTHAYPCCTTELFIKVIIVLLTSHTRAPHKSKYQNDELQTLNSIGGTR